MHIGFFTPEYVTAANPDGGLANYLRKTGLALAERGHQVSVFVLQPQESAWQDGAVQVYGVTRPSWFEQIRRLRPAKPLVAYWQQVQAARRLANKAWEVHANHPFDVFQASSYCSPGFILRRNGRVPLVCRVSSYTPLLRQAYGREPSLGDRWCDRLERRQVLDADACFAPSLLMADTYARCVGRRPDLLRTPLDDTILLTDPSFYQANYSGLAYLLFFGTLSRIKGVDLLAEALPALLEAHPQLSVLFIGRDDRLPDGKPAFDLIRSSCQAYADRLYYHPALSKAQLYPVIEHALGVLMPSRIDNYPNAALEAFSLGVPVIGLMGSSLEEIVTEAETGFLACNGDSQSLSAAIQRLLDLSPGGRQSMRQACLAAAAAMRSEDRMGQLITYYEVVIRQFREKQL
jgi:glycosyltransferase involved in cell wall biosynthesis